MALREVLCLNLAIKELVVVDALISIDQITLLARFNLTEVDEVGPNVPDHTRGNEGFVAAHLVQRSQLERPGGN